MQLTRTTELQLQHPDFPTVFGTVVELGHLIAHLSRIDSNPVIWARTDTGWTMVFDSWPEDIEDIANLVNKELAPRDDANVTPEEQAIWDNHRDAKHKGELV